MNTVRKGNNASICLRRLLCNYVSKLHAHRAYPMSTFHKNDTGISFYYFRMKAGKQFQQMLYAAVAFI